MGRGGDLSRQYEPVGAELHFPGNYTFDYLSFAFSDSEIKHRFEDLVNVHPTMLLELDLPDFATPELEEGSVDLDNDNTVMRTRREHIQTKFWPTLRDLINFPHEDPDQEFLEVLYDELFTAKKRLIEAVYELQVLEEAGELITAVAPSLKQTVADVLQRIVQIRHTGSMRQILSTRIAPQFVGVPKEKRPKNLVEAKKDKDNDSHWNRLTDDVGIMEKNGIHILYCPDGPLKDIPRDHGVNVLINAHELLHAITDHLIFDDSNGESSSSIFDRENKKRGKKHHELHRVLIEGIAIALEYDIIKNVQIKAHDEATKKLLADWGEDRLNYLRKANRLTNPTNAVREVVDNLHLNWKLISALVHDLDTANLGTASYSEGARLAIGLKRKGWTLDKLPELAQKIRQVIADELGMAKIDVADATRILGRKTKLREFAFDALQLSQEARAKIADTVPILKRFFPHVSDWEMENADPLELARRLNQHMANLHKPGTEYTRIIGRIRELMPS